MNAPESRRRLARSGSTKPAARPRRTKAFLAELRRQCERANQSDRKDDWQAFIQFPK
jgi:hypothetical protein